MNEDSPVTDTYDEARAILANLHKKKGGPPPIASRLLIFDLNNQLKVAVGLNHREYGIIDVVAIARSGLDEEQVALVSRSAGGMVMHLRTSYAEFIHMNSAFMRGRENPTDMMDLIGDRENLIMEKLRAEHSDDASIAKALTFKRTARSAPAAG